MGGGGAGIDWGVGGQGSLSEESDISAEPWLRGVWWGEFRAAGMVDTKLWGSEGFWKAHGGM